MADHPSVSRGREKAKASVAAVIAAAHCNDVQTTCPILSALLIDIGLIPWWQDEAARDATIASLARTRPAAGTVRAQRARVERTVQWAVAEALPATLRAEGHFCGEDEHTATVMSCAESFSRLPALSDQSNDLFRALIQRNKVELNRNDLQIAHAGALLEVAHACGDALMNLSDAYLCWDDAATADEGVTDSLHAAAEATGRAAVAAKEAVECARSEEDLALFAPATLALRDGMIAMWTQTPR